jgi:hypothetical protein
VICAGNDLTVSVMEGEEDADRIFALAAEHSVSITSLAAVRSTLEEIFLQAVGVVRAGAVETVP